MTGTQAIDRAAQLLVLVVENESSSSVGELAEAAGLPKSTVSRAVSALERQGLVQRSSARGSIRPGPVLLGLARRGVGEEDIAELCREALDNLADATGETIDLAVAVPGGSEKYIAQVDTEANMGVGAQARFARANKNGEIPGKRKINTVAFGDDKADAATSVQEERRLIQQEGVFAIVPTGTVFVQSEVPEQTHTPVLGYGIAEAFCGTNTKSYFFGFNGCVVPPDPKTAVTTQSR